MLNAICTADHSQSWHDIETIMWYPALKSDTFSCVLKCVIHDLQLSAWIVILIVILSDRDAFSIYLLKLDGFTVLFDSH